MNSQSKDPKPSLRGVGPGFAFYRIELPLGLPTVDDRRAAMFRIIGKPDLYSAIKVATNPEKRDPMSAIPPDEREGILLSLAGTYVRSAYHHRRFGLITELLDTRVQLVGAGVATDTAGRFALMEAAAMLVAARMTLDQVLYIAGRRKGMSERASDALEVSKAIKENLQQSTKYSCGEVRELQARRSWFCELNTYRNVLAHRGWSEGIGGYYPRNSTLSESKDPEMNLFLLPDPTPLEQRNRPHRWTYKNGARLEDLVFNVWGGLCEYLDAVGTQWGGAHPVAGKCPPDKQPNILVVQPMPVMVAIRNDVYIPLFTSEAVATEQRAAWLPSGSSSEPFAIRPIDEGSGARFTLCLGSGALLPPPLRSMTNSTVRLVVDPCVDASGHVKYNRELANVPVSVLVNAGDAGHRVSFSPLSAGSDEVFIFRSI